MQRTTQTPVLDSWQPSMSFAHRQTTGKSASSRQAPAHDAAEDLVFDPESLVLARVGKKASLEADCEHAAAGRIGKRAKWLPRSVKLSWTVCAVMLVGGVLAAAVCLQHCGEYSVESRLVYIVNSQKAKGLTEWSVEKDLEGLKNPEVAFSAAQELCMRTPEPSDSRQAVQVQPATWTRSAVNDTASRPSKLTDPKVLAQWLLEALRVESERSGEATKVAMLLKGDDVAWLQTVLDVYVRHFIEYRSTMESNRMAQARLISAETEPAAEACPSIGSEDELKKLEQQERGFMLAMRLMDSGPGTFGGFIPDANLTGTPSLARFQDKIVELEIKKRGLLVQFTPGSKEVRAVDQEIKGIRGAMRECLAEYTKFLKSGKQCLLSHKEGRRAQKVPQGALRKPCRAESSGQLPNGDTWFRIQDGLLVVSNTPSIVEKPLLVRANEYTHKTVASLPGGAFISRVVWSAPAGESGEPTTITAAGRNYAERRETSQWPVSDRNGHAGVVWRASDSANGSNSCNLLPDIMDSLGDQ